MNKLERLVALQSLKPGDKVYHQSTTREWHTVHKIRICTGYEHICEGCVGYSIIPKENIEIQLCEKGVCWTETLERLKK
jgi:hypothetical protein